MVPSPATSSRANQRRTMVAVARRLLQLLGLPNPAMDLDGSDSTGPPPAAAEIVDQAFRQNAAGAVPGAENEDVDRLVDHG